MRLVNPFVDRGDLGVELAEECDQRILCLAVSGSELRDLRDLWSVGPKLDPLASAARMTPPGICPVPPFDAVFERSVIALVGLLVSSKTSVSRFARLARACSNSSKLTAKSAPIPPRPPTGSDRSAPGAAHAARPGRETPASEH